jgi:hypothetical protein
MKTSIVLCEQARKVISSCCAKEELLECIRAVSCGRSWIPHDVGAKLAKRVVAPDLTRRETDVLGALSVSEQDGTYRILAELPGLSPNDVRVEVEDDALVLQGERQVEREANEGGIRRSERQFGFFDRRIPLPEGAKTRRGKGKVSRRDIGNHRPGSEPTD